MLKKLTESSLKFIETFLSVAKRPIIMCSFGKDSLVMLDLVRKIDKLVPVLFFREPFEQKKYTFANKLINDLDLWVYDFHPFSTETMFNDGHLDIVGLYNIGNCDYLYKPIGLKPITNGNRFICAVDDIYGRPRCQFDYKWDVTFNGTKRTDVDPLHGEVNFSKGSYRRLGNSILVYPVANWTDKDIWEYIVKYNVPYDDKRYNKDDNFKEHKGYDFNTDYFESCYSCLDPEKDKTVYCPKDKKQIKNIGKFTDYKRKLNEWKSIGI